MMLHTPNVKYFGYNITPNRNLHSVNYLSYKIVYQEKNSPNLNKYNQTAQYFYQELYSRITEPKLMIGVFWHVLKLKLEVEIDCLFCTISEADLPFFSSHAQYLCTEFLKSVKRAKLFNKMYLSYKKGFNISLVLTVYLKADAFSKA